MNEKETALLLLMDNFFDKCSAIYGKRNICKDFGDREKAFWIKLLIEHDLEQLKKFIDKFHGWPKFSIRPPSFFDVRYLKYQDNDDFYSVF